MSYDERCKFLATVAGVGNDWRDPAQSLLWRVIKLKDRSQCVLYLKGGGSARGFTTTEVCIGRAVDETFASQIVAGCMGIRKLSLELDTDGVLRLLQMDSLTGEGISLGCQLDPFR